MSPAAKKWDAQTSGVVRRSYLRSPVLPVLLALFVIAPHAEATTTDAQLQQYITNLCAPRNGLPPGWDVVSYTAMCANTKSGTVGGIAGSAVFANLGTINAGSEIGLRSGHRSPHRRGGHKEKVDKGASADDRGWGFLVTPQYGKSNRSETDLENGYQSNLAGLVVGVDYRYSDSFVLGGTLGQTRDNATFLNAAGSLKTHDNTFTLYSTWLPTESVAVDGYLGYGKINFDSQRHIVFGPTISGTATGTTSGSQFMAGLSASYQKDVGRFNLVPFANLDFIKTSINGYNESGTTTLEMHYGNRSTLSLTSNLGSRVSTSYGREWGTLTPSARFALVHEFQNRVRQINNELVSTPGTGFLVATDAPDRNYLISGLGVSAALNGGTQLFVDYEKRTQDRLLGTWTISAGVLAEF